MDFMKINVSTISSNQLFQIIFVQILLTHSRIVILIIYMVVTVVLFNGQ